MHPSRPSEAREGRGAERVRFGDFEFDRAVLELRRGSEPVRLALLPARLLALLVERPGTLVPRDAIKRALWDGTVVQYDTSLNFCINQLRTALGDDAERPRYVETLRGRGYRFVAAVETLSAAPATVLSRRGLGSRAAATVALVVVGLGGGMIGAAINGAPPGRAETLDREEARRRAAARLGTKNLDAFDAYRRGRQHYVRYSHEANESAIVLYERALEHDPAFTLARAELANALAQRARLSPDAPDAAEAAERMARQATVTSPDLPEGHKALGLAYTMQGRLAEALAAYEKAVELRHDYGEAVFNAGRIEHARGRLAAALEWQRRLIAGRPGAGPRAALARTLWDLGFEEPARGWAEGVLADEPSDFETRELLIGWAVRQGRLDDALEGARRLVELYPTHARSLVDLGVVERMAGRLDAAVASFEAAVQRAPRATEGARLRLAEALWAAGDTEAARPLADALAQECREAIDAGSEVAWWPWSLSVLAAASGRSEEATRWLERSFSSGRRDWRWDAVEPAFARLRGDAAFEAVIAAMRDEVESMRREVAAAPLPEPPSAPDAVAP